MVGGVTAGPETRLKYVDDKPQPSSGTWSVEGDQLVLRSEVSKDRVEYTVVSNAQGAELTLPERETRQRSTLPGGRVERYE